MRQFCSLSNIVEFGNDNALTSYGDDMCDHAKISILMTSYNHAPYLAEQLDSIFAQSWDNWDLTVSDNGSDDGSWEILKGYENRYPGRVKVVHGPGGFPENHFFLAAEADPSADYYAWCDSDDVWPLEKLSMAMEKMVPLGQDKPVLYGGRESLIDLDGREYGLSTLLNRLRPTFGNALEESVTGGPTILFNRPARELIALGLGPAVPACQDWWAYLIVTGAGGRVIYDERPIVRYRLHRTNLCNRKNGIAHWLGRLKAALKGRHKGFMDRNLAALSWVADRLTPENREKLALMIRLHGGGAGPLERMALVRKIGLCRQSRLESASIYALALLGRL